MTFISRSLNIVCNILLSQRLVAINSNYYWPCGSKSLFEILLLGTAGSRTVMIPFLRVQEYYSTNDISHYTLWFIPGITYLHTHHSPLLNLLTLLFPHTHSISSSFSSLHNPLSFLYPHPLHPPYFPILFVSSALLLFPCLKVLPSDVRVQQRGKGAVLEREKGPGG